MKLYKYKLVRHKVLLGENKLYEFSRRGWELVSVVPEETGYVYYFKRETSLSNE